MAENRLETKVFGFETIEEQWLQNNGRTMGLKQWQNNGSETMAEQKLGNSGLQTMAE